MSTTLQSPIIRSDAVSLRVDESSTIRVGGSRITLDLIVEQYQNGMTPEDMVRAYDTLYLPDVYDAIGYYLRHRDEIDAYIKHREDEAAILRARIEAEQGPQLTKAELLARLKAKGEKDAAPGH